MRVELIYDTDCPNVAETRANLLQAFAAARLEAKWTEWERSSPSSPAYAAGFGSPTILVDGLDVAGDNPRQHISCCRLYASVEGRYAGAPSVELLKIICPVICDPVYRDQVRCGIETANARSCARQPGWLLPDGRGLAQYHCDTRQAGQLYAACRDGSAVTANACCKTRAVFQSAAALAFAEAHHGPACGAR